MAFDFSTLITDRTQQDVSYVIQLIDKLVSGTATTEEEAEWNSFTLKGAYNYTDLNRVTDAMEYMKEQMNKSGYAVAGYAPVRDGLWAENDTPTVSQMNQYIANVEAIRATLAVLPTTPETPADMELFTWMDANIIEEILLQVETVITYIKTYAFQRITGTFYAGNYGRLQWFSRGR